MYYGYKPLVAFVYKYSYWEVLYFVIADVEGRIKPGIIYLSKHLDQFSNASILFIKYHVRVIWIRQ